MRVSFFICLIKSPQCTDKYSKKIYDSDFPSQCFDVPKRQISLPVGYKTARPKQGTEMIVTSFQDFKLREKQISQSIR